MDGPNLHHEFSIGLGLGTLRPSEPGIVATRRHHQNLTHPPNWKFILIGMNEHISHAFGLEKIVTTFFRMSRSCRKTSFSRRKRCSSASSAGSRPLPGKARVSPCRNSCTHLASRYGVIPSSPSIARNVVP